MAPSSGELWQHPVMPTYIDVDCLLPTGILIVQRCKRESTLEQIKQNLWREARSYPLYNLLLEPSSYIFKSVTLDAEVEEFYDETRKLCDLKLFQPMLKLIEPQGNIEEKLLNSDIGQAMGMSVNELDMINNLEIMTFRRQILDVCVEAIKLRGGDSGDMSALALYKYPSNIESKTEPPEHVKQAINDCGGSIFICVWVVPFEASASRSGRKKYTVKVNPQSKSEDVIMDVIRKRLIAQGTPDHEILSSCQRFKSTYVLRVCGLNEYLTSDCPISQYKYIRKCILEEKTPQLMLIHKEREFFPLLVEETKFVQPSYRHRGVSALETVQSGKSECLFDLTGKLRIKIQHATYITVTERGRLMVKAGIYNGMELICPAKETSPLDRPKWEEYLEFDLQLKDIPRSAKLCLGLCSVSKKSNRKQIMLTSLYWGNIHLFNFLDQLCTDKKRVLMVQSSTDDHLNPLIKPVRAQPNELATPSLDIEFEKFQHGVMYPSEEVEREFCMAVARSDPAPLSPSESDIQQINEIAARDRLDELAEQERHLLWTYRHYCMNISHSLPKLLLSCNWNSREDVARMYNLLDSWPVLEPEVAMELLDCTFPDPIVRGFAVKCLEQTLDDNKLSLYLLQFVQALKFELYIDNKLTRFLLKRALLNRNIGHFFFWHLKSEMHSSERQRFGLLLEAYCRGCGNYVKSLIRQVEALDKLTNFTEQLKQKGDEDQKKVLEIQMSQLDYVGALQNLISPLDCSHLLGSLKHDQSKVMPSKKRPLKLTWSNDSPLAEYNLTDFKIIFKNGDDLRQDMLTLQVIKVMDSIWQSEGLDMKMLPYGVLATGNMVGLISVVQKAETVMHIQRGTWSNAMQFSSSQLHKWLKEMNDPSQYDRVIDNFTRSCAGYSIATFVLGIGDRHNDNIMVTQDGKLFHIDFGHFLDHKKKKFGVNRERVPFVLTDDLIVCIAKGNTNGKSSHEFIKFQELCGKAYMCLRKHSSLLCTLFSLMLNSGIPELQSQNDIGYLRKTLAVDSSEEVAVEYFQSKFNEAYNGAWTKKVDWFFHWLKNKHS